jgi:hypothetical protein
MSERHPSRGGRVLKRLRAPGLAGFASIVALTVAGPANAAVTLTGSGPLTTDYVGGGDVTTTVSGVANGTEGGFFQFGYSIDGAAETVHRVTCDRPVHTAWIYCPTSASSSFGPYGATAATQGAHTLALSATTVDAHGATTGRYVQSFTFYVDHSAPVVSATGFVAYYDPDLAGTVIAWPVAADPNLPDGSPGAGGTIYSYRVSRAGGAYSLWTDSDRPVVVVPGPANSDTFAIDVKARDRVGNQSGTVSASVAATPVDPQAICDNAFATDEEARLLFCHTYLDPGSGNRAAGDTTDDYGLNPLEKDFCLARPYHCQLYANDAAQAFSWTGTLFTGKRTLSDSTRANAFQHAVWNALMVESDDDHPDYALDFSTRHEDEAYNSSDQQVAYRSLMDIENNKTGNLFGQTWSPTKNDLFMCQGMLDNNRNSGVNIGPDVNPTQWMADHGTNPRQLIWRKSNTYDGTVNGTHYAPVLVEPTSSKCH